MESILANFSQVLSQNIWLAFVMALAAGLVSSFSPCVLSSIPLVIGYVGGYAGDNKKRAFKYSLFFCFGLAATFTALGAASALLGRLMTGAGKWWYIILGLIMLIMAFQMLGIFNIMPQTCKVPNKRKGLLGNVIKLRIFDIKHSAVLQKIRLNETEIIVSFSLILFCDYF